MINNNNEKTLDFKERKNAVMFDRQHFQKLVINDLSGTSSGRQALKKYTQSQVREYVENFKSEKNQEILRNIAQLLWALSPQFKRLIDYLAGMPTFSHTINPIRDLKKLNTNKVLKQYAEIGELLKLMSIKHEMQKVLQVIYREDIFYGYIHREKKQFYIQQMPSEICKASSVEDGVLNYSVDMTYFEKNEDSLGNWAVEIQQKYREWKSLKSKNSKIAKWVELEAKNTICIKANEHMLEIFPPFAGTFDSIFDIDAFKSLRKDKERLGNYMVLTQKLPIREDSDTNNDFLIDKDFMMYFHNQASEVVPDNVGIITSPMEIQPVKFEMDKVDRDGVGKATRDFWESAGTSKLLFSSDNNSSAGLAMSIKSDEEAVFSALTQIKRWMNRYLKFEYSDLYFNVDILPITIYNQDSMSKMYQEAATYGVPVKSHLGATVGLEPIEIMNMSYLENDLLKMHEEWIPLQSSHTMSSESGSDSDGTSGEDGRPPKTDPTEIADETQRDRDKAKD